MAGDLPPVPGQGPAPGPPPSSTQWAPAFPIQQPPRPRAWSAISLAAIAALLGAAALVVALTGPASSSLDTSSVTSTPPSYSADQTAAAHQQLCDAYKLAAAGVAGVNAAVMLEQTLNATPAIPSGDRATALALAAAYTKATAMGSSLQRDDPAFNAEVDDVNAKDGAMKRVCGG